MKQPITYPPCQNPKVPEAEKTFYHRVPLQMRFNDIDMLGHLNNTVYIEFFDLGKSEYFKSVMVDGIDLKNIPIVVVNINCNFYSPTYVNENLEVVTAVVSMSERSLKMEQRIINPDNGDVKCVATTIMAGFDVKTAKGAPLDSNWVAAISNYESNV